MKAEYRFLPNREEWLTGLRYFGMMLPVIGVRLLGARAGAAARRIRLNVLQALGTFLAILWVVALSEEFFFRGLLQQWLERWTGKRERGADRGRAPLRLRASGLSPDLSELAMGDCRRHSRRFLRPGVAEVAQRSGRMVTHALIVTVWRSFLQ